MEEFSAGPVSRSADAVPAVPQSTTEVTIRTLQSDLEMIGKSGGLSGQGMMMEHVERVAVAPEPEMAVGPTGVAAPRAPQPVRDRGRAMVMTIVILVIAAVLFAFGFFLAPLFG